MSDADLTKTDPAAELANLKQRVADALLILCGEEVLTNDTSYIGLWDAAREERAAAADTGADAPKTVFGKAERAPFDRMEHIARAICWACSATCVSACEESCQDRRRAMRDFGVAATAALSTLQWKS